MGKWTNQGFVANTLSYYKGEIQNVFKEAFGDDFDLNDNLPQGVLIQRLAELFYGMDMDGIEAFSRLNLNTMGGVFLDVIGNLRGITRVLGQPQTGIATVSCSTANFVPFTIPEGTEFTVTQTGDKFVTTRAHTFSTNNGPIEIAYSDNGNSSSIVGNTMSVENYPQIQNIEIISLFDGTENESDIDYRARLQREYPAAVGTIEWVNNLLRAIPSVKAVGCMYNDTAVATDIPAYSTEWMVAPVAGVTGEALEVFKTEVAETIVDNKVPGAPTAGNTTMSVQDTFGSTKTVKFTIATEVPIQIQLVVSTPESTGVFDLGGVDEIKQTVADYVNGLDIGKDVSFSRCIAPFAADKGFDITEFKMSVIDNLVDDNGKLYLRAPVSDDDNALAWKIKGGDGTIYYTAGTTFPEADAKIYSNTACTEEFATIVSAKEATWLTNQNLVINAREYASLQASNIEVEI